MVVLRGDLTHGQQVAQAVHAAGESVPGDFKVPSGTISVALAVPDEPSLRALHAQFCGAGVPCVLIEEHDGSAQAIGCLPTYDRAVLRRLTSHLPLAGRSAKPK